MVPQKNIFSLKPPGQSAQTQLAQVAKKSSAPAPEPKKENVVITSNAVVATAHPAPPQPMNSAAQENESDNVDLSGLSLEDANLVVKANLSKSILFYTENTLKQKSLFSSPIIPPSTQEEDTKAKQYKEVHGGVNLGLMAEMKKLAPLTHSLIYFCATRDSNEPPIFQNSNVDDETLLKQTEARRNTYSSEKNINIITKKSQEAIAKNKTECNAPQMDTSMVMVPTGFLSDLSSSLKAFTSAINNVSKVCEGATSKQKGIQPLAGGKSSSGGPLLNETVPNATLSAVKPAQLQQPATQNAASGDDALAILIKNMQPIDPASEKILREKIASFVNERKAKTPILTENVSKRARSVLNDNKLPIGNPSNPKRRVGFSAEDIEAWAPLICAIRILPEYLKWPNYPSLDHFGSNYGFLKTAAALVSLFKKQAPEKTVLNEYTLLKNSKKLTSLCEMVYAVYVMSAVHEANKSSVTKTEEKTDEKTASASAKKRKHDDDSSSGKNEPSDDHSVDDKDVQQLDEEADEREDSDYGKHKKKRGEKDSDSASSNDSDGSDNSDVVIEDEYE